MSLGALTKTAKILPILCDNTLRGDQQILISLEPEVVMGYPAYQCFKTTTRVVYCSSYEVKNHDEGKDWVKKAMKHYNVPASQIHKVYESQVQPNGAIIYPP